MSDELKQDSTGKGAGPEVATFLGLSILGAGIAFEYSYPMAMIVVGTLVLLVGLWSCVR